MRQKRANYMKNLVIKLIELESLNSQYGNLSCFDFPAQYNKMDQIQSEVMEAIKKTFNDEYLPQNVYTALEAIANDYTNENISADAFEDMNITLYSRDEFLEMKKEELASEEAQEVFSELFSMMDSNQAQSIIERKYMMNNEPYYTDKMVNFIIIAE